MPLLNYTTTISADKTVGEIQALLVQAGASRLGFEYTDKAPSGILFELHGAPYRLPCRFEAVQKVLARDRKVEPRYRTPDQARRVAWRILKAWLEAQLAIIQTGMVEAGEVFHPYQVTQGGATVYEQYVSTGRRLAAPQP